MRHTPCATDGSLAARAGAAVVRRPGTLRATRAAGRRSAVASLIAALALAAAGAAIAETPAPFDAAAAAARNLALMQQSPAEALAKSRGCLDCHRGIEKMHRATSVKLGCTDCHGGDATAGAAGAPAGSAPYDEAKKRAHVAPRFPAAWPSAANPPRSYTRLLRESPEFVRFLNPGDLRVAQESCGGCHQRQVEAVAKSTMTTSAIFWAAAAYANGVLPTKRALLGESYGRDGGARRLLESAPLSDDDRLRRGALPGLFPLPRFQVVQPGAYFRAFERGGLLNPAIFPEIGNPNPADEPGRPDTRVSERGRGTGLRVSPALINLHKTRLNDPHLSFLGTNDHPGDYRSSGCTACHVTYANDRDPLHSGGWARFGHRGLSASGDPTLPRDEPGHPILHRLTRAIPTSQCMVCHMHQPNAFLNTYLGYTMWDYETDGELLWPAEQRRPTLAERRASLDHNPEGAAARGRWSDPAFLERVSELNPQLQHTRFADYHGHGWIFRAVYKRDRAGNLLDAEGRVVPFDDPARFDKAVHLRDVHLEGGMHCVDCHFSQDAHGTGLIHGEYGDAIEIECEDCHGTADAYADLRTSGPAAPRGGNDLKRGTTTFGAPRFEWRDGVLYQRSMLEAGREWRVKQVKDTVTPGRSDYNPRSARAKTLRRDGGWGGVSPAAALAHRDADMTCYSCHSSWITSCFGCHLPQEQNQKSEVLHYEGETLRNYASYNPQVIRTDVYMLGRNGRTKGGKIAPVRSSSALVLSSINLNRQRIYVQQPPISAPGFSSQAFNPHVPHTVRTRETRQCSDCHVAEANDNNAWLAQLLTLGTGFVNFVGRNAWVGLGEHGLTAIEVTEWDEPQAVIGSFLHRLAYPDDYRQHLEHERKLEHAHHHPGAGEVKSLQLRGEYLYAALGRGGFRAFDVANVDNKDFSERIVTAPFSPLGQDTHVPSRDATAVALPTTMPVAPWRTPLAENLEQPMHPIYHYALVGDREEGLILVDVDTLSDGEPRNNFLRRALTWNPEGLLAGLRSLTVAGTTVYAGCDAGLVVLDLDQPLKPRHLATLPELQGITDLEVQFRYAFASDARGLAVVDVTEPSRPRLAARLDGLGTVHALYVARTYAYLAAGERGLVIVDVERPEAPRLVQAWNAGGRLRDTRDVVIGSTNASLFAYLADGDNGFAVAQLTSPATVPGYLGFSPRPSPELIATYPHARPAIALSRGLDRDRLVDESGHQVSVMNRIGARPFTLEEMRRLYLRDGAVYRVRDDDAGEASPGEASSGDGGPTP